MQISPEGSITIPANLLNQAGLSPRAEVEMSVENGKLIVSALSEREKKIEEFRKKIAGCQIDSGLNADDIMRLTRGE